MARTTTVVLFTLAFNFIQQVPVDWSETKVLNGEIGEYITIARKDRQSDDWYIGSITDENARDLAIGLSFLEESSTYQAKIYVDGSKADWKTNPYDYNRIENIVTRDTVLHLHLANGGGAAIQLKKIPKMN